MGDQNNVNDGNGQGVNASGAPVSDTSILNSGSSQPVATKYIQALPARPQQTQIQRGHINSSYGFNYSTTRLDDVLHDYQRTYTDTCFRRTGPYHGTMPLSFEKWLRAVDLATTSKKGVKTDIRAKVETVSALYGQVDKNSDSSYINLCRMTAEPFPLISSGKAATAASDKSKAQPLIDQQNLNGVAQRYARVMLSSLGKLATRWYTGMGMQEVDQHKCIVPLSLLRKTHVWTLGFKTEMRPCNPSELFYLMAKLIENFDRSTGERRGLSDADIQEYFKGPDLGDGYVIFMTDESLMTLYSAGKAAMTVVPDLTVNIEEGTIVFQRPVLDQAARNLTTYFLRKLQDYLQKVDENSYNPGRVAPMYNSFTYTDADVNGRYTTLKGCNFFGNTAETVKAELWADINLQVSTVVTNTILEPLRDKDGKQLRSREGLNYRADCKSIPESLWMHIEWEKERQYEHYVKRKNFLEAELKTSKLLEKVTRPKIADYVHSIMKDPNRKHTLLTVLGEGAQSALAMDAFSDGVFFTSDEAEEIFAEKSGSTQIQGTRFNILSILFMRDKYKDLWLTIEQELSEVMSYINNPFKIYDIIYTELVTWMNMEEYRRKSQVLFLEDPGFTPRKAKDALVFYTQPAARYDTLNMPCSIYYNNFYMAKSYGANMNILCSDQDQVPNKVINCTTNDYVGIMHGETVSYMKVTAVPTSPYLVNDVIKAIIPYSATSRILLNIIEYKYLDDGRAIPDINYFRIVGPGEIQPHPVSGRRGLDTYEFVEGYAYLDTGATHLDLRTSKGIKRIAIGNFQIDQLTCGYPFNIGTVLDVKEVYDVTEDYTILSAGYTDVYVKRDESVIEFAETGWDDTIKVISDTHSNKFSEHLELYYHTMFIPDWLCFSFIIQQNMSHGKKSVIPENRWIKVDDALSKSVRKKIISLSVQEQGKGKQMIVAQDTDNYRRWGVHLLEDWSVADKRFGLPTTPPTNPKAMEVYRSYMDQVLKGTLLRVDMPQISLSKMNIDYDLPAGMLFEDGGTVTEDAVTIDQDGRIDGVNFIGDSISAEESVPEEESVPTEDTVNNE